MASLARVTRAGSSFTPSSNQLRLLPCPHDPYNPYTYGDLHPKMTNRVELREPIAMGKSSSNKPPRKKRTRSHVIADWSVHHVEWYVLNEGWAAERVFRDYGYDLTITTFDQRGYAEAGPIQMRLKATEKIGKYRLARKDVFSFSITRADFNLWTETVFPVFFVLYDAVNEVAYWQ